MKFDPNSKIFRWIIAIAALFFMIRGCSSCFKPANSLEIIRTVKAVSGDLTVTVTATGEVKPYNRVEIKPPIAGRVEEVLVKEGESVSQGKVLAWMSSTERAALLDAARSRGEEEFKQWQSAYKPAPLMAPLDGTIIVRAVEPGQTVTTADPVVVISDRLIVKALVDETDLAQIEIGPKVKMFLDAYRNKMINGKVDHISHESQLINNVNVYDVDIVPEEVPASFRSGMTANVTFMIANRQHALLIPSEAITELPKKMKKSGTGDFAVYKKDFGGKLTPVPVEIGESDGRMTEIVSGLKEGMEIAVVRKKQDTKTKGAFSPMGQRRPGGGGQQRGGG